MTYSTRFLTVLAIATPALWAAGALSQAVEREPTPAPITLTKLRSDDRLVPTPDFSPLASGLYGRQIVTTAAAGGDYTVQIWSLLVSPKTTTGAASFPGAPVLIVQTGSVELLAGDRRTRLEPGAVTALPEGEPLRFINPDQSRPAHLRAVVLVGNR